MGGSTLGSGGKANIRRACNVFRARGEEDLQHRANSYVKERVSLAVKRGLVLATQRVTDTRGEQAGDNGLQ